MILNLVRHTIRKIQLADETGLEGDTLQVNPKDLEALVSPGGGIRLFRVAAVHPGEPFRFGPVLDGVEPRAKEGFQGSAFPGWTGSAAMTGKGSTHVLDGMAIFAVARLPGIQQGIIDMAEEARPYCPFAQICNLVLLFETTPGIDRLATDDAIRRSLLRVAEFLASLSFEAPAAAMERWQWPLPPSSSPRAALLYLVQSQGDLRRTYFFGRAMDDFYPAIIDPLEILDGAIVSGNFVLPSNKTCTYIHQNHPLIREMLRRHGTDLTFAGAILANEASRMEEKEKTARAVEELAERLKIQGVVVNQEGGGNTLTDLMLLCRQLSRRGIRVVLLVNEFAGADGRTPSLMETTPEAEAIISAGNNDHRLHLPAPREFIGFAPLDGIEEDPSGPITLPLARIYASTNQLGFNRLSCRTR